MRIMKTAVIAIATAAGLGLGVGQAATIPLYTNSLTIREAPQVDATAFLNSGQFDIFTSLPFSTLNTLNFTNRGQMFGTPGWRLDHATAGGRGMMSSFVNQGLMESRDFSGFFFFTDVAGLITVLPGGTASVSYMLLSATNVFNRGLLSVGSGGLLKIQAETADLRFSGLRSGPPLSGGGQGDTDFVFNGGTNYFNATGVRDVYWGVGVAQALAEDRRRALDLEQQISDGFMIPSPRSPIHEVQTTLANSNFFSRVRIPGPPRLQTYGAFANTGVIDATNEVVQVVFLAPSLQAGNVTASVRFLPEFGGVATPIVRIAAAAYDNVLDLTRISELYISDDWLTRSNSFLSLNGQQVSARPANYRVSTAAPFEWFFTDPPNAPFNFQRHIYSFDPNAIRFVTNDYTGYSFTVNRLPTEDLGIGFVNLPSRGFSFGNPFAPSLFDPTNLLGRVEIDASRSVDLRGTRLRANQYAIVRSPEILTDENTSIDAPFISLDVGRTDDTLSLEGAVPSQIDRISGQISLYSARWTNQVVTFVQGPDNTTTSNVTLVAHHVFIVDHQNVERTTDVTVTEAFLQATNIVVADDMRILRGFRMQAPEVTLRSELLFVQDLVDLGPQNFPVTKVLKNEGEVINNGNTIFPGGPGAALSRFENSGEWHSGSHNWNVPEFANSGVLFAVAGPLAMTSAKANLSFGSLISNFDMTLNFGDLDASFSTISAGTVRNFSGFRSPVLGKLRLSITGQLNDGGPGLVNDWNTTDGFELLVRPTSGDFRGTRLNSSVLPFNEVIHKWAGTDLGATSLGFINNASLSRLVLTGEFLGRYVFETINGNNAIYTEYLEVNDWAALNLEQALEIRPGMRIYFAASNLPVGQLDGMFEGRLRLVAAPPGPAVTTLTLASGQTLTVQDNLLNSTVVDSDGDGIPNAFDENPFDEVRVRVSFVHEPATVALISWDAAPRTQYEVQYKDEVAAAEWQKLTSFVTYSDKREVVIEDTAPASTSRYYRVIYTP